MGTFCQKPDRDVAKLKCGYPLPCPWHTVIIDVTGDQAHITIPAGVKAARGRIRKACQDIHHAMRDGKCAK